MVIFAITGIWLTDKFVDTYCNILVLISAAWSLMLGIWVIIVFSCFVYYSRKLSHDIFKTHRVRWAMLLMITLISLSANMGSNITVFVRAY